MARPKSEDKRNAIMQAATRVIVAQGLSAPTALIAREAGVSNGSLFTYFETKADLFNQLYLELKSEMAAAALAGQTGPASGTMLREQAYLLWSNWMGWAAANREKRAALTQLGVCDEITPETRAAGHQTMAAVAVLLEAMRAHGPMRDSPMGLVLGIMNAVAEATIDFVLQDPPNAEQHCKTGFDALWRVLG